MLCTISSTLYKLWLCPDYSSWILWKNLKKKPHTQQILCFVTYRTTSTSLHAKRPPDFLFASIVQILNENNCFICRTTQGRECHSSFVETGLCWWTCGKNRKVKFTKSNEVPKISSICSEIYRMLKGSKCIHRIHQWPVLDIIVTNTLTNYTNE